MLLSKRVKKYSLEYAANMLRVIAHPVRLNIIDLLLRQRRLTVLDIQTELDLDQAIASQHLILMKDKGVLIAEKVGRNRFFSLAYPNMKQIIKCLEDCCNNKITN